MLSDTIAEIIIRGRNETAVPFAEASAGLRAIQAEADRAGIAMGRAGGTVNGASRSITASSIGTTNALEAELAAAIATADAHSLAADKDIAASQRVLLSTQGRSVQVARAFEAESKAALDTAVTLEGAYTAAVEQGARETLRFGEVSAVTKAEIERTSAAMLAFAEATKLAGDATVGTTAKTSLLGKEFLRVGDTATIAGARVRVFDSLALGLTGNVVLLGAAVAGLSVKEFADFQQKMQQVGANTGLTQSQIKSLTQTILDMGTTTPTSIGQLADGFRHIISEGYNLRDSVLIARAALDAADATGASFADTASTVATEMHNWGDGANKAAQDTGALLVAAQEGNTTLQGLVGSLAKVGVEMSAIHQPMTDAVSLVSELSRATGDPAIAGTWAAGLIAHLINPTKQAITVMGELKVATGIDLQKAMQEFASHQISFADLMNLMMKATHGSTQELYVLGGGLRGGLAAVQLANGGLAQYQQIVVKAADGAHQLKVQADAAHDTLLFKFGVAVNDVKIKLVDAGALLNTTADGIAHTATAGSDSTRHLSEGVTTLTNAIEGSRKALELHITSLEKQKTALEASGASVRDNNAAGGELAGVIRQLTSLQDRLNAIQQKSADATYRQSAAYKDLSKAMAATMAWTNVFAGKTPTVYIPPTDQQLANKVSQADANVTAAQTRLAYDEINKHTQFLAEDRKELQKALAVQKQWNDALGKNASTVDAWTQKYDAAQKAYTTALDKVRLDLATHSSSLRGDQQKLAEAKAALAPFEQAIKDTTASTKAQKTSVDALQKVQADLAKAEAQVYKDIADGKPVTDAQKKRIIEDTAEIKKMTDAVSGLTGKINQQTGGVAAGKVVDVVLPEPSSAAAPSQLAGAPNLSGGATKSIYATPGTPAAADAAWMAKAFPDFAAQVAAAGKALTDAEGKVALKIYDLHHGISDTLGPLSSLEAKAQAAQSKVDDLATAATSAAAAIADLTPKIPDMFAYFLHPEANPKNAPIQGPGGLLEPNLAHVVINTTPPPNVGDPNSARETTLSAALVEFQHQSVLLGQQRDLNADQIKIEQDKNRVDAGNAKLALDYLKYIAMQSDPKATQADKAAQLQLIKGDVNANVENAGELSSDIGKAVADAQQAVDAARQNVQAAQSAIVVGLLQEQVTELSDLTGIMQAEANIQTALVNGQIAAINDQSAIVQDEYGIEVANGEIMKASGEITKATDANSRALALAHMVVAQAQLKVAEDHLEIDKTKAQADVVAAAWAVKIAEAEAHMAKDKLQVDKANAEANNAVATAHLAVANQQLKIATDQAKLTQDIADSTNAISVAMGNDPANIAADKAMLAADTAPLQGLMENESTAQQKAQETAAQGAYTLGQDQAGITGLQISATSDSQNYALQLASLTAKEGKDAIDLQRAQAASAALTASNTTTANTLLQTANNSLQERNDALTQLIGLMAQGVSWNGVGGDFKGILDQLGLQVHTNK